MAVVGTGQWQRSVMIVVFLLIKDSQVGPHFKGWGWRDGSGINSTDCSSKTSRFDS